MVRRIAYSYSIILGILLAGCSKSSSFEGVIDRYEDSSTPLYVEVSVGDPHQGVNVEDTKSFGAVDELIDFKDKKIMVFAFSTRTTASYKAQPAKDDPSPDCLLAKMANLNGTDGNAKWADGNNVPYPMLEHSYSAYHFFASYIDDAAVSERDINRTDDNIVYNFTINGMQDLMSSKAEGSYSYETARKDIQPVFRMQHRLVKFRFRLKPGVTPGQEKFIRADALCLYAQEKVSMPVASRDGNLTLSYDGDPVGLFLTGEKDGLNIMVQTVTDESLFSEDKIILMADDEIDCLLVPPAASYAYDLYLSEAPAGLDGIPGEFVKDKTYPLKRTLSRKDGEEFKAGNAYTVTFEVFGNNEVSVSVDLADWEDGGLMGEDKEHWITDEETDD